MVKLSLDRQIIKADHIANFRELGGYKMKDGRTVRRGLLLRGSRLKNSTDNDIRMLHDVYRLAYVFDFRTQREVEMARDRDVPGAEHVWLPTINSDTEDFDTSHLPVYAYKDLPAFIAAHASEAETLLVARDMYTEMVVNEYTQLQYSSFIQMVASVSDGAVFWHCSQGKDRTGLGAALLLAALGASRETIIADFDLSNDYYAEEMQDAYNRIEALGVVVDSDVKECVEAFVGASTVNFVRALDLIDSQYGSMEEYIANQICLVDADIEALRNRFLE